jgi:pimeloyl-ACP methyl ester carboxylesterase
VSDRLESSEALTAAPPVRLRRHVLEVDGHPVAVAVSQSTAPGVPFVMVHGFGVESLLYAQPLARLVGLGFRVIAIDVAGHGGTRDLGWFASFDDYSRLLRDTMRTLGIRRAVLAGHSMGGRLVTQVAVSEPSRALAVLLLDAIVGESWERWRSVMRWVPPALAAYAALFALDLVGTVPIADVGQSLKLGRRMGPTIGRLAEQPWHALVTGQAILRAGSSTPLLDALRDAAVPAVVVHGDHDLIVPFAAARDTAARLDAPLVTVHGGGHSWMLRDPEALPALVGALLVGGVLAHALAGVDADECIDRATFDDALGGAPFDVPLATPRRAAHTTFSVVSGAPASER